MGILDSLVGRLTRGQNAGPYALNDEDRQDLKRQGLLQAGLAMLASPSNGTQGIARGLLAGVQGVQDGAGQLVNDRYRTDVMQRTRSQMEANTAREEAVRGVLNPDGTLNTDGLARFRQIDPLQAIQFEQQIKELTAPKPFTPNPTRTRISGRQEIQEEFNPTTGQWTQIGVGERWGNSGGGGGGGVGGGFGKPPSGYRWTADGTLAAIPGGPADKGPQAGAPGAPDADPMAGFNDRQRAGAAVLQNNALNYAASVTGKSVDQLRLLEPSEIAKLMREAPARPIEGGRARVLSAVPMVGDLLVNLANSDVSSWSKGAASGLANVANPAGTVGEGDMRSADAQVMNPLDPRDVQATKIEAFLKQTGFRPGAPAAAPGDTAAPPPAAPAGAPRPGEVRNGYRFKGGNPADRTSWEKV